MCLLKTHLSQATKTHAFNYSPPTPFSKYPPKTHPSKYTATTN